MSIHYKGQFYARNVVVGLYLVHIDDGVNSYLERLTEDFDVSGLFFLVPYILTDSIFV